MYGSFRFYGNCAAADINESVLQVFERFNALFSIDFDQIYYRQFDPESDGLLRDRSFAFDAEGKKRFLAEEILPPAIGPEGDASLPFLGAACRTRPDRLFSKMRCEITIGKPPDPTDIRMDFHGRWLKRGVSVPEFKRLLSALSEMGFVVNTAFYHASSSQKEAAALDGGHIGHALRPWARRMQEMSRDHGHSYHSDRLPDVFCANALPLETLEDGQRQRIEAIAGRENTFVLDERLFCFALPRLEAVNGMYRIQHRRMIRRLRECIQN